MSKIQSQPPVIPAATPSAAPAKAEVQAQSVTKPASPAIQEDQVNLATYTVKKGDTLWGIAKTQLSDAFKWPEIHALNKGQVKNPDLIYPGQVLTLPKKLPALMPAPPQTVGPVEPPPAKVVVPPVPLPISEPVQQPPAPVVVPVAEPAPVVAPPAPKPGLADQVDQIKNEHKSSGYGKAALIGGAIGTIGTAGALFYVTKTLGAPASNLGGYATAQIVSKSVNTVIGKVGLKLPTGPALSGLVSKVGGPKMAGSATAIGVGLAAAGLAVGGLYLYNKMSAE